MVIPCVFKKCSKCGRYLVASNVNFSKSKSGKYGLRAECKECQKKYHKRYYEENKEAVSKRHKRYRETNKEAVAEMQKKWNKANKERIVGYNKKYRETHIEYEKKRKKEYYNKNKEHELERTRRWRQTPEGQINEGNRRARRRAKEQIQGSGITSEQWLECMKFFEFRCAYSGIVLTKETRSLDHINPIIKGGEHEIWNLVPMYKPYNCSKNAQDFLTWYTKQEYFSKDRLNKIYEWQNYAYNKYGRENLTEAE